MHPLATTLLAALLAAALPNAQASTSDQALLPALGQDCAVTLCADGYGLPGNCTLRPDSLGCGGPEACGIIGEPTCWTVRFVCHFVDGPAESLAGFGCEDQPTCCDPGNCNNYGVLVVVSVDSHPCEGEECRNEGVLVAAGDYCSHGPLRACVGSVCAGWLCATRLLVPTTTGGPALVYLASSCPL